MVSNRPGLPLGARGGPAARGGGTALPAPLAAAACLFCFTLGATLNTMGALPSLGAGAGFGPHGTAVRAHVRRAAAEVKPIGAIDPVPGGDARSGGPRGVFAADSAAVSGGGGASGGDAHSGGLHGVPLPAGAPQYRTASAVGATGNNYLSVYPFQVLSWSPRALYFPAFANHSLCEEIIKMSERRLGPSALALKRGQTAKGTEDIRTSSGTFLSANRDGTGALAWVERKIAEVTGVPPFHGEAFNVLRYTAGQHYDQHYDTFDPAEYGKQSSQRMYSFLLYLSDGVEGGETIFPKNDENLLRSVDYKSCDVGLKVSPRRGDALLFYNIAVNGTFDKASLHGGCPVKQGTKWVATKWVRDNAHGTLRDGPFDAW